VKLKASGGSPAALASSAVVRQRSPLAGGPGSGRVATGSGGSSSLALLGGLPSTALLGLASTLVAGLSSALLAGLAPESLGSEGHAEASQAMTSTRAQRSIAVR
jgi:hypothetical protein